MLDPFDPDAFIIHADVHIQDIQPRIFRSLELPVSRAISAESSFAGEIVSRARFGSVFCKAA
ncbi:hypothetical protein [Acidiphilium sp. MT5]